MQNIKQTHYLNQFSLIFFHFRPQRISPVQKKVPAVFACLFLSQTDGNRVPFANADLDN